MNPELESRVLPRASLGGGGGGSGGCGSSSSRQAWQCSSASDPQGREELCRALVHKPLITLVSRSPARPCGTPCSDFREHWVHAHWPSGSPPQWTFPRSGLTGLSSGTYPPPKSPIENNDCHCPAGKGCQDNPKRLQESHFPILCSC